MQNVSLFFRVARYTRPFHAMTRNQQTATAQEVSTPHTSDPQLPLEIWRLALALLRDPSAGRAVASTCKALNAVVFNWEELWREVLLPDGAADSEVLLALPAQVLHLVQTLSITKSNALTGQALRTLARHGGLPALHTLVLSHLSRIDPTCVTELLTTTPRLKTLQLGGSEPLPLTEFVSGLAQMPSAAMIQTLDLSSTTGGFVSRKFRLHSAAILDLAPALRSLTSINLSNHPDIGDEAVAALAMNCSQTLTVLDISWCGRVSDHALEALGRYCHRLESFNAKNVWQISDDGMTSLATGCRQLRWLDVSGCDKLDRSIRLLAEQLVHLQKLYMCRLSKVYDEDIAYIATSRAETLRVLAVSLCDNITSNGVAEVCLNLTNLHTLAVANCSKVTGQFLGLLAARAPTVSQPFRHLEHLNLRHCKDFGVDAMRALTELLGDATLKRFYAGNSFDRATSTDDDESLQSALLRLLDQAGRRLEVLDLENFSFFDDSVAEQLPSCCGGLTKLVVNGTMITTVGLKALATVASLRELSADYCVHLAEIADKRSPVVCNRIRLSTRKFVDRGITPSTPVPGAPVMP